MGGKGREKKRRREDVIGKRLTHVRRRRRAEGRAGEMDGRRKGLLLITRI